MPITNENLKKGKSGYFIPEEWFKKNWKRKFAKGWAKYLLWQGEGNSLTNHFWSLLNAILIGTVQIMGVENLIGKFIPDFHFSGWLVSCLVIGMPVYQKVQDLIVGWWYFKSGFWLVKTDYAARKLSPFNQELLERIKNIEDILNKNEKRRKG